MPGAALRRPVNAPVAAPGRASPSSGGGGGHRGGGHEPGTPSPPPGRGATRRGGPQAKGAGPMRGAAAPAGRGGGERRPGTIHRASHEWERRKWRRGGERRRGGGLFGAPAGPQILRRCGQYKARRVPRRRLRPRKPGVGRAAAIRETDDTGLYRESRAGLHLGSLRGGGREREEGPPRRWPQAGVATEAGEGPASPPGARRRGLGRPAEDGSGLGPPPARTGPDPLRPSSQRNGASRPAPGRPYIDTSRSLIGRRRR